MVRPGWAGLAAMIEVEGHDVAQLDCGHRRHRRRLRSRSWAGLSLPYAQAVISEVDRKQPAAAVRQQDQIGVRLLTRGGPEWTSRDADHACFVG